MDSVTSEITIQAVAEPRELRQFLDVPFVIYSDDPNWVAPLDLERRQHLSAKHNPYFEHATYNSWIAYREGKPVGRISAQIDQHHLDRYQDATGFFGMLEAENNPETFEIRPIGLK